MSARLSRRRTLQLLAGTPLALSGLSERSRCAAQPPAPAAARRRALLVGITEYPIVLGADQRPVPRLPGAASDIKLLERLLLSPRCGVPKTDITLLPDAGAKGAAIRNALETLRDTCASGDWAWFHFSGRGSLAVEASRDAAALDGFPATLVPVDAAAESPLGDIPLDDIARWAKQIAAKGATPVVTVDACFSRSPLTDRSVGQVRPFNPQGRCLIRNPLARPRLDLWPRDTPGVFLCAADVNRQAFEAESSVGVWRGIFTDRVANLLMQTGSAAATPRTILSSIEQHFTDARGAYGDNCAPYPPPQETLGEVYDTPFLGLGAWGLTGTAPVAADLDGARRDRPEALRVAVVALPVSSANAETGAPRTEKAHEIETVAWASGILSRSLPAEAAPVRILQTGEGAPDRIVEVRFAGSGAPTEVRVTGSEAEKQHHKVVRTFTDADRASAAAFLRNEVSDHLKLQALIKALFVAAEGCPRADTATDFAIELQPEAARRLPLKVNDWYGVKAQAFRAGVLLAVERQGGDQGVYELFWPSDGLPTGATAAELMDTGKHGWAPYLTDNRVDNNWRKALPVPRGLDVTEDQRVGTATIRFVLIASESGLSDPPPLKPPEGATWPSVAAWDAALRRQLTAAVAVAGSQKNRVRWTDVRYEVAPRRAG